MLLIDPFLGDGFRRVLEAMLLAPVGVGCLGGLGDAGLGVREDEPDVQLGVLRLDEQMLLPIFSDEAPLGLNEDTVRELEVWGVLRLPLWLDVRDDDLLVAWVNALRLELVAYLVFKARSEAFSNAYQPQRCGGCAEGQKGISSSIVFDEVSSPLSSPNSPALSSAVGSSYS